MKRFTLIALLASVVTLGAASAQNAPVSPGIPNGLSGPGGTETFKPAPSVPNLSTPGTLPGVIPGNASAGHAGAISGTLQPRPRTK